MRSVYRERGPIITIGQINPLLGRERLMVFAIGPRFNQQILSNPETFRARGMVLPGPEGSAHQRLRHGLISMNGDQHRLHRSLLMPLFNKRAVEGYRDNIVALTSEMLETWNPGQTRDIWRDMQALILHISSRVLFGGDEPEEARRVGWMIDEWLAMCFSLNVWFFRVNVVGSPYRRLLNHAKGLEARIAEMIEQRRGVGSESKDVISTLVRAKDESGNALTQAELIGQTSVLFGAAHETCMSALTWTLFLLSQHPQVMADLIDELRGELRGEAPTIDQFDRLPLLERVIKEGLRILPPVVFNTRIVDQPVELGPYHLPKAARVLYSHFMTHRLPELYSSPDRFHPDRWVSIEPSPYEYLPFGAGPRLCIGYAFSMTVLRICLAMILQRFRVSLVPGAKIDYKFAVTLSPKYGMPMTVNDHSRGFNHGVPRGNIHELVDLPAH
jgi:cytochrome P450